jgi:ribonucleoside-diphosphate reductase alpha chain
MSDKVYTYDEALVASKDYFHGNDLAARVFLDKYAMRNKAGDFLEDTPHKMHDRLAHQFARTDEKYGHDYQERLDLYRQAMDKFARIVPQGSPMAAVGNAHQLMSASNCVVIASPKDSMGGIVDAGKELAELYKRRCGVGIDISTLRPEGASVNNAARTTTGAWSFADYYSYITRKVGQAGRRGALMITMDVHHPDVLQFTTMKHDKTQVTGANVSLRLSDEFLAAVEKDDEYEIRWPVDSDDPKISKKLRARDVWDTIVKSATENAEPGLIMWGNMVRNLPAHCYEDFFTISTNPCSEIALSAYDSCRLISINLTGYVRKAFEDEAKFDFKGFKDDVRLAMQMADNLVDIELGLIDRIKKVCEKGAERDLWNKLYEAGRKGRRTGLGTHGLADTLAQLCIRYDSESALAFVDKLYKTLRNEAYAKSVELAQERGAFPVFDWETEKDCAFIKRLPKSIRDGIAEHGRRNIALLTQAPTGSVSLLSKVGEFDTFNVSSGVEPVFRNSYTRRKKINPGDDNARIDYVDVVGDSWQEFKVYHSNVQNFLDKAKETFIGHGFNGDCMPEYFVTSDQIDWEKRVEIQGAEQKYIDHSISSTINLPRGTDPEVVGKLYLESWKRGLKGVTVYVDGSRDGVLVTEEDKEIDEDGRPLRITHTEAPKRPKELMAEIHNATVKGVRWTVIVGLLHGEPYELFMGKAEKFDLGKLSEGKILRAKKGNYNLLSMDNTVVLTDILDVAGSDEGAWITRMMSMALRHGVPIEYIADQLSKDGSVVDLNNVLARLLKRYVKKRDEKEDESCPQCASHAIVYEEGCKKCSDCGWAGCG